MKKPKTNRVLFLAALMALATACKKDPTPEPTPTPNHPTDTVTPVDTTTPIIPTREIVVHWDWDAGIGWAPPKDSIKYYTKQADVKIVDINLIDMNGIGFPVNCTGFRASAFHKARDTLQTRIDIDSSKVKLSGTILINFQNGATIPDHTVGYEPGITPYDSAWFVKHGCIVRRPPHAK